MIIARSLIQVLHMNIPRSLIHEQKQARYTTSALHMNIPHSSIHEQKEARYTY